MIRPILFNTEMVTAILEDKKTETRRLIKFPKNNYTGEFHKADNIKVYKNTIFSKKISFYEEPHYCFDMKPPFYRGDILYVRETWNFVYEMDGNDRFMEDTGHYVYYAEDPMPFAHWTDSGTGEHKDHMPWRPSIHMPKEAARIWLKVTEVRVERLQEMNGQDVLKEGINSHVHPEANYFDGNQREMFEELWNSTIKKSELNLYGWEANPWVWVIEFEKTGRPEGWCI